MSKIKSIFFCLTIFLVLVIVYTLTYTYIEPAAYDFMVKNVVTTKLSSDSSKNIYGHDDIILVVIDDATNEKYPWPWTKPTSYKLYEYFSKYAHPRVLVRDSLLTTLDKDSERSEHSVVKAIYKINNLVEGFQPIAMQGWEDKIAGSAYDAKFVNKFGIKHVEYFSKDYDLYQSLVKFPEPYFNAIAHVGSVSLFPSFLGKEFFIDETIRNYEYILNYKNDILPSIAMEAFLVANNNPKLVVREHDLEFPSLNYKIPQFSTSFRMMTPIKFYRLHNGYSHNKISAVDIMDSYDNLERGKGDFFDPKFFDNKIVVIGANVLATNGLNDIINTPMSPMHPGVDVQATALDNLLHGDFMKIIPFKINVIIAILFMFALYMIVKKHETTRAIIFCLFSFLLYFILSCILYYHSIVISVTTPIVMGIITLIIGYTYKYTVELKNKEKVKSAMGKYVSEDVMARILQNIDNLGLGGKRAVVTVLFSDIRGFTSMSEKMSAESVSELLNEYFSEMEPIVSRYNGIINKFIGDAVMAIFGEPIQDDNHPLNAVKCASEMLEKVKILNKKWENEGKPLIEIGIGINTGEVFIGNIGSARRMEYTVIGDTVNLASRLESYNKVYKTNCLISSSTYEASKSSIETRKIPEVEIRGKAQKIDIYEVLI